MASRSSCNRVERAFATMLRTRRSRNCTMNFWNGNETTDESRRGVSQVSMPPRDADAIGKRNPLSREGACRAVWRMTLAGPPSSHLQPFLAHRGVGAQVGGGAFEHDAAVTHHV